MTILHRYYRIKTLPRTTLVKIKLINNSERQEQGEAI